MRPSEETRWQFVSIETDRNGEQSSGEDIRRLNWRRVHPTSLAAMSSADRRIVIWDIPTRLFHWLIVALIVAAYVTWRLDWMNAHAKVGDAVLTLVIFRLLWGFFGSETARFSRFIASSRAALSHLAQIFRREPDTAAGHNPAGAYSVIVLLALLLAEALSGLYVGNDVVDQGPLTELVPAPVANAITALHWIFWDALLAAAVLHVLAITVYALAKGQNLLKPMITGCKTLPATVLQPQLAGPLRATAILGCSAIAAAALINLI
jgi:cytochrome b